MDTSSISPLNQIPTDILTSAGNRLESKVRAAQSSSGEKQKGELKKVAQEFEAVFIAYLLKVMRETIEDSGLTESGFGKSIYTELFDQEVSLNIARHGALGISDLLYRNLSSAEDVNKKDSDKSPAGDQDSGREASPVAPNSTGQSETEVSDLQLPVQAPISSGFGVRIDPFSHKARFHKGLDLAAPEGMRVVAALPGTVISAGYEDGYGNTVLVQHDGGVRTRYGHLGSINVRTGDVVTSEETLGTVGNTGRSTGPHLHFEVIRMGQPVNPIMSFSSRIDASEAHPGRLKTGG